MKNAERHSATFLRNASQKCLFSMLITPRWFSVYGTPAEPPVTFLIAVENEKWGYILVGNSILSRLVIFSSRLDNSDTPQNPNNSFLGKKPSGTRQNAYRHGLILAYFRRKLNFKSINTKIIHIWLIFRWKKSKMAKTSSFVDILHKKKFSKNFRFFFTFWANLVWRTRFWYIWGWKKKL